MVCRGSEELCVHPNALWRSTGLDSQCQAAPNLQPSMLEPRAGCMRWLQGAIVANSLSADELTGPENQLAQVVQLLQGLLPASHSQAMVGGSLPAVICQAPGLFTSAPASLMLAMLTRNVSGRHAKMKPGASPQTPQHAQHEWHGSRKMPMMPRFHHRPSAALA